MGLVATLDYVTISTAGNGADFGDLTQAREGVSATASKTRGIFAGGYSGGNVATTDYITIAPAADATDFGN